MSLQLFRTRISCNRMLTLSYQCSVKHYSMTTGSTYNRSPAITMSPQDSNSSSQPVVDFTDHKKAFEDQTFWKLSKAFFVFRVFAFQNFSANSLKLFNAMNKYLGTAITSVLVKPFYDQFVGGDNFLQIKKNMEKVSATGCGNIILIVAEAIQKQEEAKVYHTKTLEVMEGLANQTADTSRYMQIRLTAFLCTPVLKELSMLSLDKREQLSHSAAKYMSSCGSLGCLDWLSPKLSSEEMLSELKLGLQLLSDIGQKAVETNTVLMVDAEYININPAITALYLAMALNCNTNSAVLWNTTQCYLKSSYEKIQRELNFAEKNNIHFGAKIVRGAYIVPEKEAARLGNYPSPVHDSYEDTNKSYDKIVDWLLYKISSNTSNRDVRFILASHNKNSVQKAIQRMKELNMPSTSDSVLFGQTYGMYDAITFLLGKSGYSALKSMPIGSVSESLPYLSRRAQENTAIIAGSKEERLLLKAELLNRIKFKS